MKNKKLLLTVIFVVLAVLVFAGIFFLKSCADKKKNVTKEFESAKEASEYAGFSITYSDRLSGFPVSGFTADGSTITVLYGGVGYFEKKLRTDTDSDTETVTEQDEPVTEHIINGVTVYFSGDDESVTAARWVDNGFDYTIKIIAVSEAVTAEEMTDYVLMSR